MRVWWWVLGIVAAAMLVFGAGSRLFVTAPTVGAVSFVNDTTYAMAVEVGSSGAEGWLPLGTAERGTITRVVDVVDQGDEWIFRFRSQGRDGGQMRLSKDELVRAQWRVVIPGSIAARLEAQGAPPTPIRENT